MRHLIFYLIAFFTQVSCFAQQENGQYHSLLWRISGNGLTKPSYLYGTMHLTDRRLFYFGDSLYKALEESEGFAAELDMSTCATQYINMLFEDENQRTRFISDILDEKKLNQYKADLEKKFHKPVSEITTKEIETESQKIRN